MNTKKKNRRLQTTRDHDGNIRVFLNSNGYDPEKKHPKYRGTLKIHGQRRAYDVSLWVEQTIDGTTAPLWMSGEVTLKVKE